MKGFLLGALVLTALDLLLTSNASRVANVPVPFTNALSKWMDPGVPLISDHSGSSSTAGHKGPPPGPKPPRVRAVAGKCPPGYVHDPKDNRYCLLPPVPMK